MNRHTPGPWRAIGDNIRSDHHADGTGALLLTAGPMLRNYTPNRDEEQANLRLAAAAPTLLAAAEMALYSLEDLARINAGENEWPDFWNESGDHRNEGNEGFQAITGLRAAIAAASGKEE